MVIKRSYGYRDYPALSGWHQWLDGMSMVEYLNRLAWVELGMPYVE